MPCCGKAICSGCSHEHDLQINGIPTCPFCRAVKPSAKECIEMMQKRVDSNDADAINQLGQLYSYGDECYSIKKNMGKAVKLYHRSAELGSAEAYHNMGVMYARGDGVSKDETKAKQYFEKGAIGGCNDSRYMLGCYDVIAGSFDQAIKHWLIAAKCGDIRAVNCIKDEMTDGDGTRDHYDQALRSYESYLDAVMSDQRDRAAAYSDDNKYLTEA
jgi:TPR repeat protein